MTLEPAALLAAPLDHALVIWTLMLDRMVLDMLGELGTGCDNYAGDDSEVHPVSRYWRPQDADIPLKAWAEEQRASAQ